MRTYKSIIELKTKQKTFYPPIQMKMLAVWFCIVFWIMKCKWNPMKWLFCGKKILNRWSALMVSNVHLNVYNENIYCTFMLHFYSTRPTNPWQYQYIGIQYKSLMASTEHFKHLCKRHEPVAHTSHCKHSSHTFQLLLKGLRTKGIWYTYAQM